MALTHGDDRPKERSVLLVSSIVGMTIQATFFLALILAVYAALPLMYWETHEDGVFPRINETMFLLSNPAFLTVRIWLYCLLLPVIFSAYSDSDCGYPLRLWLSALTFVIIPSVITQIFSEKNYTMFPFALISIIWGMVKDTEWRNARAMKYFKEKGHSLPDEKKETWREYTERGKGATTSQRPHKKILLYFMNSPQLVLSFGFAIFYIVFLVSVLVCNFTYSIADILARQLPVYFAMSDGMRVVFVTVIHSIFSEVFYFSNRRLVLKTAIRYLRREKGDRIDDASKHIMHDARSDVVHGNCTDAFADASSHRRNPIFTTVSIMGTGFEEIILRSTLKTAPHTISRSQCATRAQSIGCIYSTKDLARHNWKFDGCRALFYCCEICCHRIPLALQIHVYTRYTPVSPLPRIFFYNVALEVLSEIIIDVISVFAEIFGSAHSRSSHMWWILSHLLTPHLVQNE